MTWHSPCDELTWFHDFWKVIKLNLTVIFSGFGTLCITGQYHSWAYLNCMGFESVFKSEEGFCLKLNSELSFAVVSSGWGKVAVHLAQSRLTPELCATSSLVLLQHLKVICVAPWLLFITTDLFILLFLWYLSSVLSEYCEDVTLGFAKHDYYKLPSYAWTFLGVVHLKKSQQKETMAQTSNRQWV